MAINASESTFLLGPTLHAFLGYDVKEQWMVMQGALGPLNLSKAQMTRLFLQQLIREAPWLVLTVGIVVTILGTYSVKSLFGTKASKLNLPVLGGSKTLKWDFQDVVEEGARKYPKSPYVINASGLQYIVYPSFVFDEVKRLSKTVASAQDFFYNVTYGRWTQIGKETDALWKTIGVDLARSVPIKVYQKQQDCQMVFNSTIDYCPDWKEVELFPALMKIIATTNACSFVGRKLGTSEPWVNAVQNFPMSAMFAIFSMSVIPKTLRPLLAPLLFIPNMKVQRDMKKLLAPVITADMEQFRNATDKKELLRLREEGKVPFTAWLMSRYKPEEATLNQLTIDYLIASFESTASSAATLYNIVADLAARPEYVDMLREELATVMKNGKLPLTHLKELKKMDSVMRESFRINPFGLFSLYRVAKEPIKLSIGPTVPPGSIICVDSHHINKSADLWSEPESFDGKRFLQLREQPGNENRHQFISTGADAPNWGDGNQACPGRFFANSTLKIALSHLLMEYDVKFRDGEGRPNKVSMPNGSWAPDIKAKLLFKSRK